MKTYEAIREIRLSKSMNQQVIADLLDVDVAVISNIEKGKRDLKLGEIEKISNLFAMPLVDLITYPDVYVKKDFEKEEELLMYLPDDIGKNSINREYLISVSTSY